MNFGSWIVDRGSWIVAGMAAAAIRHVGAAEVAGALGLILPALTGVAVWLVPTAAIGLVVPMAGAVRRHLLIGEGLKGSMPALTLGTLAFIVAVGRIAMEPF